MMKWSLFASDQPACATALWTASKQANAREPQTRGIEPPIRRHQLAHDWLHGKPWREISELQEAVGVDVDRHPDLAAPLQLAEPVADHVLHVEAARRVDQDALAMTAAKHRQRCRRRPEHGHPVDLGRRLSDPPRDGFRL